MKRKQIRDTRFIRIPLVVLAILLGLIFTLFSLLIPAPIVLGDYVGGIPYHGFPVAWTGHIVGFGSMSSSLSHITHAAYIFGFIIDVIFWTVVIYLFVMVGLNAKKK